MNDENCFRQASTITAQRLQKIQVVIDSFLSGGDWILSSLLCLPWPLHTPHW